MTIAMAITKAMAIADSQSFKRLIAQCKTNN